MGRKAKLKQERRTSRVSNIIDVNANDNNWLYIYGGAFAPEAQIVCHGTLDTCIDRAISDMPTLATKAAKLRADCGEYGLVEGTGWGMVYKSLYDRGRRQIRAK